MPLNLGHTFRRISRCEEEAVEGGEGWLVIPPSCTSSLCPAYHEEHRVVTVLALGAGFGASYRVSPHLLGRVQFGRLGPDEVQAIVSPPTSCPSRAGAGREK